MKKIFTSFALLSCLLLAACSEEDANTIAVEEEQPVIEEVEQSKENKEVTYYEGETKPFIDDFLKEFDSTWNNIWVLTMDRLSANEISAQDAHTHIKKVHDAYRELSVNNKIPNKELSKDNKKLAKDIVENLNMSAVNRQKAAEIALEILETNSNAKINEMNEEIEWSNNFMGKAQSALIELESNLYQ
ncbi:MAG: hypothetical protein ACI35V_01970 [Sphingobacterium composti]